ncbi:MAG: hypothetical protein A2806_03020 [Candidatus Terrybacteria bacterium RIFCSPHIGHO2_01_FULL_48_17]|uniref:Uncharacterized protein n=1 Tax=Candidatus Terrybacteria bacterium RIFCSPHIGHO2_01_FULL_48_17 TaxID=1802362 RepID=A0A1G2PJA9_9BACT|nr:MAG: hypothetical protein A2806_03020 [Candidatus Terrybacteria bacterium RIFCSPHIGHO2_01_FULL_48_17]OHA53055.1 MAG: hypothetical protein A3A30_02615 [Candidatus Terrybacteria bacterium RIFCSPLOWO2_01_FULL_48_14]
MTFDSMTRRNKKPPIVRRLLHTALPSSLSGLLDTAVTGTGNFGFGPLSESAENQRVSVTR